MNWYYEFGGQQQGPVSDAELDRLIADGRVTPATLVWREGQASWQPLREARPSTPAAPHIAPTGAPTSSEAPLGTTQPADAVRCSSCGNYVSRSESIQMGDRIICSVCKPAVMQSLAQGGPLPLAGDQDRQGPPWEHRSQLGLVPAAVETVKAVIIDPTATFMKMRCTGGLNAPFLFFLLTGSIGSIVLSFYILLTEFIMRVPNMFTQMNMGTGAAFGLMFLLQIIQTLVVISISAFLQSGIVHVCMMVCGGAKKPFETTFRSICYASGAVAMLHCVPVIGTIVAATWGIAVQCIGLARSHETDTWRAVLAVFMPLIICCVLGIIAVVAIAGIASASHAHS